MLRQRTLSLSDLYRAIGQCPKRRHQERMELKATAYGNKPGSALFCQAGQAPISPNQVAPDVLVCSPDLASFLFRADACATGKRARAECNLQEMIACHHLLRPGYRRPALCSTTDYCMHTRATITGTLTIQSNHSRDLIKSTLAIVGPACSASWIWHLAIGEGVQHCFALSPCAASSLQPVAEGSWQ